MHLIIPCAGRGQRFRDHGYRVDKALIQVGGRRIIDWALSPIPASWQRYFIVRQDQTDLADVLRQLGGHVHVLPGRGATEGAAVTTLSVAVALPPDAPVVVMNCDQYFEADLQLIADQASADEWAGYILTFPGSGPQWSYALADRYGYVTRVLEKIEAPDSQATVGLYGWASASLLVASICRMVAADDRTRGEYYLAPAYNHVPGGLHGRNLVKAVPVRRFLGLGTPEQVRLFEDAVLAGAVAQAGAGN